jgi:hypothetical protein
LHNARLLSIPLSQTCLQLLFNPPRDARS